ncbi:MAG: FadR family transcriptional regulator [Chloroflexi bacterium]|nr:MAG: FadR family transcriptional regulator [Chloroflexota bacterium]
MLRDQIPSDRLSEFLCYLACNDSNGQGDRIPPLAELSTELGLSVASLREQLEVAKAMGLVEARPRTGIRKLPYTFRPAVVQSLNYGLVVSPEAFKNYSDLRNHIEAAYWSQAVQSLNETDHAELRSLIARAREKLHGQPVQIPHAEHRALHLLIYKRLNNPFVTGLLEAYWEVYEAFGLNVYSDLEYHVRVWDYHARMVDAICNRNFTVGYEALMEHMDLIYQREKRPVNQAFE